MSDLNSLAIPKQSSWKRVLFFLIFPLILLFGLGYLYRVKLFVTCFKNDTCARLTAPLLKYFVGIEGYAMLSGIRQGLGASPLELGKGIGHFTLKHLPGVLLTVPRQYINFMPNEPDGETDALSLTFYFPGLISPQLPGLISYTEALNPALYCPPGKPCFTLRPPKSRDIRILHIDVFLQPKQGLISCWDVECLGQEFALFQSDIEYFQDFPPASSEEAEYKRCNNERIKREEWDDFSQCGDSPPRRRRTLQNGHLEAQTGWIEYPGAHQFTLFSGEVLEDRLYLKPGADPSNPGEWILCEGAVCLHHFFRNGLYVKLNFPRKWLAQHHQIRALVNQKLDEFITLKETPHDTKLDTLR